MNDEIIKALHATKERLAQDAQLDIKRLIESVQREEAISAAPVCLLYTSITCRVRESTGCRNRPKTLEGKNSLTFRENRR